VVYKAHLQWYQDGITEVVAVKTLKGTTIVDRIVLTRISYNKLL